jgi:hypothetical protein
MGWIHLAEDRNYCEAALNIPLGSVKCWDFLELSSIRTFFHGDISWVVCMYV